MIKIFFAMITMFWILGISQGYVLQGSQNMIEIEAQFTIRNRLDIGAMMKLAGYTERGDFLYEMEKATGDRDWDRNVEKGQTFIIPSMHKPERQFNEDGINYREMMSLNPPPDNETEPEVNSIIAKDELDALKKELERLKQVEKQHKQKHMGDMYVVGEEYKPTYESTVNRIKERGYVVCGTYADTPGFSEEFLKRHDDQPPGWYGFDIDICRAFAVALFLDKSKIKFITINGRTRFERLFDGSIDILSATTTWTFSRDVDWRIEFLPTVFYDGQGFIVRKNLGVKSAKDMMNARVCFNTGSTAAQNIRDFFDKWQINFVPVAIPPTDSPKLYYLDNDCDMYGTDMSALAGHKARFQYPERHIILPEIISKEPLGPAIKYGDQRWSDITRWTVNVLFLAEELGITSQNVEDYIENIDPVIQRFMGERNGNTPETDNLGAKLGLAPNWSIEIIRQIGNYEEIYERHVGPNTDLGLKRGYNKLYTDGGLLYAPPLK